VDQLASAFSRAGHQVVVVTTANANVTGSGPYRVVQIQTDWAFADTPRIAASVRRLGPDVVDVQYPGVGLKRGFAATLLAGALRLTGYRGRLVTTLHEFDSLSSRQRLRIAIGAAAGDVVLAPDERILRSIRRYTWWRFGLRRARIELGSNVLPTETGEVRHLNRTEDELVVGYWGFLRPDKGVDVLLDAFALVRARRAARLVVAGNPGDDAEYRAALDRHIADLGLRDDVLFTGDLPMEELSSTLRAFDVCALPYRDGVAPNRGTYVTAVAHGLYVVTTSREHSGFDAATNTAFVPPGDAVALAEAIVAASDHPRVAPTSDGQHRWDEIAAARLGLYARG
jgi:glycosyltransferase involved in cell wall biosynthesis